MADANKTRAVAVAAKLVALLVAKHGPGAVDVVMAKVKDCAAIGDHERARRWAEVAEEVRLLLSAGTAVAAGDEPPLGDVLEGSVTKAVMKANGVGRQELDSLISDAKEKLGGR
jgi:hypothetical protein